MALTKRTVETADGPVEFRILNVAPSWWQVTSSTGQWEFTTRKQALDLVDSFAVELPAGKVPLRHGSPELTRYLAGMKMTEESLEAKRAEVLAHGIWVALVLLQGGIAAEPYTLGTVIAADIMDRHPKDEWRTQASWWAELLVKYDIRTVEEFRESLTWASA